MMILRQTINLKHVLCNCIYYAEKKQVISLEKFTTLNDEAPSNLIKTLVSITLMSV